MSSASDSSTTTEPVPNTVRSRNVWWFRVAAMGCGLAVLLLFELLLLGFGLGNPDEHDPFVGFRKIQPLFQKNESGDRYQIPDHRRNFFAAESFPVRKSAKTFRVFCLGGSTVQGRPWSKETSFTTFLQLGLSEADLSRDWEVINCGGLSYASYRLVPILQECLNYEPDLIILCTGHNEFLEDRTYDHIKNAPALVQGGQHLFGRSRIFTLMQRAVLSLRSSSDKPQLTAETEPILDYNDSLKVYHRDDTWHAGVVAHYESNLRRVISLANAAGVPIWVVQPPSNLGDCPPFKSEHGNDVSESDRKQFQQRLQQARELYRTDISAAIRELKAAIAIDPNYALVWHELGQCYRTKGLATQAREAFVKARDEDICPLRMVSELESALQRVVTETNTPWFDAHALLEADCRHRILDGKRLVDHVHPSIPGHEKIAVALMELGEEQGLFDARPGWKSAVINVFRKHAESLDTFYYLKGERTLEAVQAWANGRADGPAASERFPYRIGTDGD